ncbi:MAG: transposase [Fidelibacterota bacterium]
MSRIKRQFTGTQKVHILRHHLLDKTPVSDICTQYSIHPTLFYRWQKEFFEKGSSIFSNKINNNSIERELREENESLKIKLRNKNEVVSELMEEYFQLKKRLGVP